VRKETASVFLHLFVLLIHSVERDKRSALIYCAVELLVWRE
jgi:hypothetical protein